jgi:hypothetical protein
MIISSPRKLHVWQNRMNKKSSLYISQGDSWFNYPGEKSHILFPYSLITNLSNKIDILDFSLFGSTTDRIIKKENIKFIKDRLSYVLHSNIDSDIIKGFFISIGGNDLINNIGKYIKDDKSIDFEQIDIILGKVKKNIIYFIDEMKQSLNYDVKFFLHTYDYINIDIIGHGFDSWFTKTRSWVYHNFKKKGITDYEQIFKIMKFVIDSFYVMLMDIESMKNVFVIDLRGTLKNVKYWENEIHPNRKGFKILSKVYYNNFKEKMKC